jgi:ankyrin repeat protein
MLACLYAKREIVQELVRVGANIHLYDKVGLTAQRTAVLHSRPR